MAATYEPEYAISKLREAIDYAEITGEFQPIRKWVNEVEDAYGCQHKNTHHEGGVRFIAGEIYEDIVEVCTDCGYRF